ncbi:MAG TPA: glycosyltransferase family 4 protein [Amycolatopsis sp.]|nr:glycosyltransferase family 4 protein [Amycolatopsis sp.]
MPVTVVHVIGCLNRGGAESVALDLCRRIPESEVRQRFLTLGDGEGTLAPRFRAAGATVERCPLRPVITFAPRLWWRLRAQRPDVVTSHVSLVSGAVLAVAAAARVPVRIARLHSEGDGRTATPWRQVRRTILRAALRRSATAVAGVTRAALEFADPQRGDRRYQVVPNGVDTHRFPIADSPPEDPVFLHIGRSAPEKNRAFLLSLHREACRIRPGTRLVVAGPGGFADLEAAVPGDPGVTLLGETDRVDELLAAASVLLLPSRREGLPGVVLEALSTGVPVLATNLPGLRELGRQVRGLALLPLEAGPRVWARTALRLAAAPPARRREIGTALRRSPFSLDETTGAWRRLWTSH